MTDDATASVLIEFNFMDANVEGGHIHEEFCSAAPAMLIYLDLSTAESNNQVIKVIGGDIDPKYAAMMLRRMGEDLMVQIEADENNGNSQRN